MTPKEKAKEIVIKMQFQKDPLMFEQAKKCALIAVDEILYMNFSNHLEETFWKEVKKEIEKI